MIRSNYTADAGSPIYLAPGTVAGVTIHQAAHSQQTDYQNVEFTLKSVTISVTGATADMRGSYAAQHGDQSLGEVQARRSLSHMTIPAEAVQAMLQGDGSLVMPLSAFVQIIDSSFLEAEPRLAGGTLVTG